MLGAGKPDYSGNVPLEEERDLANLAGCGRKGFVPMGGLRA